MINCFGLASEQQISERCSIPGVLTKVRIKEILSLLIDDEDVLGGRFVENDLHFYYITKENYDELEMREKKEEDVEYTTKEEMQRYYLLHPNDIASIVFNDNLPDRFDVSSDIYLIVLNMKLAAQCKLESSDEKQTKIKNLNLAPWLQTESSFNYIINALENIPLFHKGETESILIERINGLSTNRLVV